MWATSSPCVNQPPTIQSTQHHLNFYTPNSLFLTEISVIPFDRHRVENTQEQKGKRINGTDDEVVKKYQIMFDYTEVKYNQLISFVLLCVLF
jgi:hypothetical protein